MRIVEVVALDRGGDLYRTLSDLYIHAGTPLQMMGRSYRHYVAYDQGCVVGCAALRPADAEGRFHTLFSVAVRSSRRREGIGRALLEAVAKSVSSSLLPVEMLAAQPLGQQATQRWFEHGLLTRLPHWAPHYYRLAALCFMGFVALIGGHIFLKQKAPSDTAYL